MQIEHSQHGNWLTVQVLEPRMDARAVVGLKPQLADLLAGHRRMILDLSHVDFIDSSGLGAIIAVLKLLGSRGDLIVAGARERVAEMLRLTHMDRILRLVDSPQAAEALDAGATGELRNQR